MKGSLYTGKLTYVNTEDGKIAITYNNGDDERILLIDGRTEYDVRGGWQNMLGWEVEAVEVDGKVIRVDYVAGQTE